MANSKFAEYATSGAFTVTLSRNQISALSMVAGKASGCFGLSDSALERKGLIEPVGPVRFGNEERMEYRPSHAGLITLQLLHEAGLTNNGSDAVAQELAMVRAELVELRKRERDASQRAWSAMARQRAACVKLVNAKRENSLLKIQIETGLRLRSEPAPFVRAVNPRDPLPHLSDAEIAGQSPV